MWSCGTVESVYSRKWSVRPMELVLPITTREAVLQSQVKSTPEVGQSAAQISVSRRQPGMTALARSLIEHGIAVELVTLRPLIVSAFWKSARERRNCTSTSPSSSTVRLPSPFSWARASSEYPRAKHRAAHAIARDIRNSPLRSGGRAGDRVEHRARRSPRSTAFSEKDSLDEVP